MDNKEKALNLHKEWAGKIEVVSRIKVENNTDLSFAYTPGVAEPCKEIHEDVSKSFDYTRRWNTIAVVTDGTAVLGLGDIGPEAGMPVMEGKSLLFKEFGDIDAIPLCIRSKKVDDIVKTVSLLAGSFGGINLEDISAPRCFEIEKKLKEICDIPIFHDDQHGTAIVTLAGLINALKIVNKKLEDVKIVMSGAGAAGVSISDLLQLAGAKNIILCDRKGSVYAGREGNDASKEELSAKTNPNNEIGTLAEVIKDADIFLGVSGPGVLTTEMVKTMNNDPIIFAMANPVPEIMPEDAKLGGAKVIATGRSDFPNQINNVLAFPGIFRGALDVRASDITAEMNLAASYALANLISEDELDVDYVIPSPFDKRVAPAVAKAVGEKAKEQGLSQI